MAEPQISLLHHPLRPWPVAPPVDWCLAAVLWLFFRAGAASSLPWPSPLRSWWPLPTTGPGASSLRGPAWVFFFSLGQFNKVLLKRISMRKNSSHPYLFWARLTPVSQPLGRGNTAACQASGRPGDRRGYNSSSRSKYSTFI